MNRAASDKSDNFFVSLLKGYRQPLALRVVAQSLVWVAIVLVVVVTLGSLQLRYSLRQHAQAIGQSVAAQTSIAATDALVTKDSISLNLLLNNLTNDTLVAQVVVTDAHNRVMANAGRPPAPSLLGRVGLWSNGEGQYSMPIRVQDKDIGTLRLVLNIREFEKPLTDGLKNLGLMVLALLALTLVLSWRLGRQLASPLRQLSQWLRDPDDTPPFIGRKDEVGDLARQLRAQMAELLLIEPEGSQVSEEIPDLKRMVSANTKTDSLTATEQSDDDEADAQGDANTEEESDPPLEDLGPQTAVLAVRLSEEQLRRLPKARLNSLVRHYQSSLERTTRLYRGELRKLEDGTNLILFHSNDVENYLIYAICCGELLKALGQALQLEIADSGITVRVQLGLAIGPDLSELDPKQLTQQASIQSALSLCQHSRNLLLLKRNIAADPLVSRHVRIRNTVSPKGACCVERLSGRYASLVDRHFQKMQEVRL